MPCTQYVKLKNNLAMLQATDHRKEFRRSTGHSGSAKKVERRRVTRSTSVKEFTNSFSETNLDQITSQTGINVRVHSGKKREKLKKFRNSIARSISKTFVLEVNNNNQEPETKKNEPKILKHDTRITPEISLFYLIQELPDDFPIEVLVMLFEQYGETIKVKNILEQRGWKLKPLQSKFGNNEYEIPSYYFGKYSYDCLCAFYKLQIGSFLTCYKKEKYFVLYCTKNGVAKYQIPGPKITQEIIDKFHLNHGIIRPPKRFKCEKCMQNIPCSRITLSKRHPMVFTKFNVKLL